MSKRYFPQQYGDRKKPKLDISRSDHNFPLSQNIAGSSKAADRADSWGDDNDDEILLLASQACEEAYNNDISLLPDYSMCMKPGMTSTQLCEPSTSTSNFPFKKPSAIPNNVLTTDLKDKCNRISSPLHGISSKIINSNKNNVNLTDDLIFEQDSDHIYRQLLQLQEENNKLKSENGKLLEKCVTKEGESSILRTQLKSCQIAVDNARMERIKAQEKVQQEWTEKLGAANSQMHDLRTQLDFKNLEIISVKEKVRMLESSKVKLTQVMVGHKDISSSQHRRNSSLMNDSTLIPHRHARVPTNNSTVQTECARILKLHKILAPEPNPLTPYLPILLENTENVSRITLNEKLQPHSETQTTKCKVYSTFHRIPTSPVLKEKKCDICIETVHKSLTEMSTRGVCERSVLEILKTARLSLEQVQIELEEVSRKMTNAFQKEMDERYIESSLEYIDISARDLISGRPLFPEEQAILCRRMVAIPHMLEVHSDVLNLLHSSDVRLIDTVHNICALLDNTSCAHLYSGLLLSITHIVRMTIKHPYKLYDKPIHNERTKNGTKSQNGTIQIQSRNQNVTRIRKENLAKTIQIIKDIISSRPLSFVTCQLLALLRELFAAGCSVDQLCPGGNGANLRLDYDQGVLLYKKDSCLLQVFLKQVEATLWCIEKQSLCYKAIEVTQNLILLYANANGIQNVDRQNRCECQLVLMQVIVYSLRICAVMMTNTNTNAATNTNTNPANHTNTNLATNTNTYPATNKNTNSATNTNTNPATNTNTVTNPANLTNTNTAAKSRLLAVCRSGVQPLYQCLLGDIEFSSRLGHNEGHLCEYTEIMRANNGHSEGILNMLSELSSAFQSSPEDTTTSYSRQPWLNSFQTFSITD